MTPLKYDAAGRIIVDGAGSGDENAFTLTAGSLVGGGVGYSDGSTNWGSGGAISREPFPGHAMIFLVQLPSLGFVSQYHGNLVAEMTGGSMKINGVEYELYETPVYFEDDDYTDVIFNADEPVFVAGNSYIIELIKGQ